MTNARAILMPDAPPRPFDFVKVTTAVAIYLVLLALAGVLAYRRLVPGPDEIGRAIPQEEREPDAALYP